LNISQNRRLLDSSRSTNFLFALFLLLSGDIQLNPGPRVSSTPIDRITSLKFALLNAHSASSITSAFDKPASIQDFISTYNLDILAVTETWLSPNTLPSTLNSLTPDKYSLLHSPRLTGRGGGLAFIFRSSLKLIKVTLPSFTSFEAYCVKFSVSGSFFTILNVYRPPSSSVADFFSEFSSLLEDLVSSPSELLLTGDFNFHVDTPTQFPASSFLSLLETFNLVQHVNFPTHNLGHTLDLLITRASSNFISFVDQTLVGISDHSAVLCSLSVPVHSRPPRVMKFIRNLKKINIQSFCQDIRNSAIYSSTISTLDPFVTLFNSTLSSILAIHAPLRSVSSSSRNSKPYFTSEHRTEKTKRNRLETTWRLSKTNSNLAAFNKQTKILAKQIKIARRTYFRNLISQHKDQPRKLWSALNSLLSRNCSPTLPTFSSSSFLASSFLSFFSDKIAKLCSAFTPILTTMPSPHSCPPSVPPSLLSFKLATTNEIRNIILSSSDATCELDPIPTKLLKSCLDVLIQPITKIVNLALSEGIFPSLYKNALVTPLLKKHGLPAEDLASYRPISNLNFVSKIIERVIYSRLSAHLGSFPSLSPFQSAYRPFHSTESALLRIQNDLLLAMDQQKLSALVLLDLSAAFDTIDHEILLTRLSSYFGISGCAHDLISSYLVDRTQSVSIGNHNSSPSPVTTGVPQGSVLGPLLFSLYTTPLSHLLSDSGVFFHLYADDTQLYISFPPSESISSLSLLSSTLNSVHSWFFSNRLSLNPSKTEFLIIGTPKQRSKISASSVSFCQNLIQSSDSCRNLGVIFDSDLSLKKHISSVCQTSFLQIRQLRQIRSSLDTNSAVILANSLVSSRLDYCNSLFFGLPKSSLHRLQLVQNSLARVVCPSVRRCHHITPTLRKLHWLPIQARITFKIACLTFKTLSNGLPSYLSELATPVRSSSLRSSNKHLLVGPLVKTANGRRSFFYAAPTVWNSLPLSIRSSSSLPSFRSSLKTYLFPP